MPYLSQYRVYNKLASKGSLKYGQVITSAIMYTATFKSGLWTQNGIGSKLKSQQIETIYYIIQQDGRNQATELEIWPVHHSATIYTATIKSGLRTQNGIDPNSRANR